MDTAKIVVHPNTRKAYAAERLRKTENMSDTERFKFLEEALLKYHAWTTGLGVLPHKVAADLAVLRCQFFPSPQRRRA
jgi:hypothetical protein